jgi:hypothetical protein
MALVGHNQEMVRMTKWPRRKIETFAEGIAGPRLRGTGLSQELYHRAFTKGPALDARPRKLVQQRPCLDQVHGVDSHCESIIDARQQIVTLAAAVCFPLALPQWLRCPSTVRQFGIPVIAGRPQAERH